MATGSQASRSVGRIVLLDSAFSAFPIVVDEGRRVIANIERVANLFVTKTVYAAVLAVTVGVLGVPFPFYPRHLTVVSALTIGVPGFFLALASGAPRARPGYIRRVARFTLPAGVVAAAATFAAYSVARAAPHTSVTQARTAATIVLFAIGLWVLVYLARPLDLARVGLVVAMAGMGALALALPLSKRVFALDIPSLPVLATILSIAAAGATLLSVSLWKVAKNAS
jgi:cation-transporting ATPase E